MNNHFDSWPIFTSLRTKLTALFGLSLILACLGLGLYFVNQQIREQTALLKRMGYLLASNIADNGRYPLATKDLLGLQQITKFPFSLKEVVYIVFTDPTGQIVMQQSKGLLLDPTTRVRTPKNPIYPDTQIARTLLQNASHHDRQISTRQILSDGRDLLPLPHDHMRSLFLALNLDDTEFIYDFAIPIEPIQDDEILDADLTFELQDLMRTTERISSPPLYGLAQIGLTNVYLHQESQDIALRALLITLSMIVTGLFITIAIVKRIVNPLKALTHQTVEVSKGNFSGSLESSTDDEIGQLTRTFNQMLLQLRSQQHQAGRHIQQLETLDVIGSMITSPCCLEMKISNVLQALVNSSDVTSAMIGLYDQQQQNIVMLQTTGLLIPVSSTRLTTPHLVHSRGLLSHVLQDRQDFVILDPTALTALFDSPLFAFFEGTDNGSLAIVPLLSGNQVLGFLATSKGIVRSQQEDVVFLQPIALKVAIGLDRAYAYMQLETLTRTLDQRVQERTDALEQANLKLQKYDQHKSRFVSVTSHELQTPLTSIKTFAENFLEDVYGPMTQEQYRILTRVKVNVNRLQRMIPQLLDLSQIELGEFTLSHSVFSLGDLVVEVVANAQPIAQGKAINLEIVPFPTLPCIVADRDKVVQILTNLIHNAITFTSEGIVNISLDTMNNAFVKIGITDSGCGMKTSELDHIFQPYYRSPSIRKQSTGSGLGLALTRHLVELHHGRIWAESILGQGSSFYFTLPVQIIQGK